MKTSNRLESPSQFTSPRLGHETSFRQAFWRLCRSQSTRLFALLLAAGLAPCPAAGDDDTIVVSVLCSTNGHLSPQGVFVWANTDMDVRAFPDLGYEVEDWYVDGACAGWGGILEQHFAFGDRDVDIYVQFQRITNGVYVESRGWGSVTPTGNMGWLQIGWNDDVTFTATPDPHFHVEAWTVDDVVAQTGGSEFTLTDVQAVRRVKVWFAIDVYTIDASAGSCGSLTPAGAVAVPYDDNQTFTATPAAGSEVEVWWLDGQRVQTNGTTFCLFDVQTNHVLRVTFSAPVLSILATPTNTIVVSWPASAEGWVLEQANVLTSTPVPWAQIPPPYPSHDGRLCMTFTNAPPLGHHFFRLRGP